MIKSKLLQLKNKYILKGNIASKNRKLLIDNLTLNHKVLSVWRHVLFNDQGRGKVTSTTYRVYEQTLLYQRLFRQAYKIFSYKSTFTFNVIRNTIFYDSVYFVTTFIWPFVLRFEHLRP